MTPPNTLGSNKNNVPRALAKTRKLRKALERAKPRPERNFQGGYHMLYMYVYTRKSLTPSPRTANSMFRLPHEGEDPGCKPDIEKDGAVENTATWMLWRLKQFRKSVKLVSLDFHPTTDSRGRSIHYMGRLLQRKQGPHRAQATKKLVTSSSKGQQPLAITVALRAVPSYH